MFARKAVPLLALLPLVAAAQPEPQASALQTVVVSATRHAMALIDAPASIDVITREQIEARGADNVFEALRGETGISIQGRTISGRKNINLRGMDARHTLMLVDGKRIGASAGVIGHTDFEYDWIAIEDIERVEVIRGPMSVLYGAEALGGVVNVITRAPGAERWSFGGLLEGSSADGGRGGGGHRLSARADGPVSERWRLAVGAAESRREAVARAANPLISDLEGRHKRDLSLRALWLPASNQRVDIEQRFGDEQRWADAREPSGARRYYQSVTDLERRHSAAAWSADWGGTLDLRSLLRAYRSAVDMTNVRNNGVAGLRPNRLDDRVFEGQISLVPGRGQLLTSGFELRREALGNDGLPGTHAKADHQSLYLQDEIELGKAVSLTAGARWDDIDRFGQEWSPRAYLVWRAAPQVTVKGGWGHGFKAPTLKQITPGYQEDEGPFTYFSNPSLRPETNDAVEFGVGWSGASAGVQVTAFRNQVTDLVVPVAFGAVGTRTQYRFQNIDRARLQGVEAATTAQLGAGFTLGLSYQYLDARDGKHERLEKRPRHMLGTKLDWAAGAWRAGMRVEHSQGQMLASLVAGQPLQNAPSLTLVSAHAGLALSPNLDLSLSVDNLGNVNLADKSPLFIYAEAPRTWRAALRGRW